MSSQQTVVGAVVGIDGCGKSSTFRDTITELADSVRVAGVGDEVLSGGPGERVIERTDIPLSRSARAVGGLAKGLRRPGLYKDLKFLEFIERTHVRKHLLTHDAPAVLLGDGDPLVNVAAWAVARFYQEELAGDDGRLAEVLHYLAGTRSIPTRELRYYMRRAWQLIALNRLHLARFSFPDVVFLLQIDPAIAMERIRIRGRPLQVHESEGFLASLAEAYERVCAVLEERCGVEVVRVPADQLDHQETVKSVAAGLLQSLAARRGPPSDHTQGAIEIVATTMSGSIRDQRKLHLIGPEFASSTTIPSEVHRASSHAEAEAIARRIVQRGGRMLVSAGGAGTFNAVLEGSHLDEGVPSDLRLAFLRKGSADLIGKVLEIPDDLPAAVAAIVGGIEAGRDIEADILRVDATQPDGSVRQKHMVGFGGFGVFGEVPRFTETRIMKYYKGILGSLFGDLGPFYVGLALAAAWWWVRHAVGRIPQVRVSVDGHDLPSADWAAVVVLNGDLGRDFPLGRGMGFAGGEFRVVGLRYRGIRPMLRQIDACRTAAILDRPDEYGAAVVDARRLVVRPMKRHRPAMINVDGLRMMSSGVVTVSVSGRIRLVAGAPNHGSVGRRDVSGTSWTRSSTS